MRAVLIVLLAGGCVATNEDPGGGDAFIREGDVFVGSAADAARLTQVIKVTGNLVLRCGDALPEALLPRIGSVEGALVVDAAACALERPFRVVMPALGRVGEGLEVKGGSTAVDVEVANLRAIGGRLTIGGASDAKIAAPVLAAIDGGVLVEESGARLLVPELARVKGDVQIGGPRLELQAPRLAEVTGDLRLAGAKIGGLDLGALRAVGADLVLDSLVADPPGTLTLPALATVQTSFEVNQARGLEEIALPVLTKVGGRLRLVEDAGLRRFTVGGPADADLGADVDIVGATLPLVVTLAQVGRLGGSVHAVDCVDLALRAPRLKDVVGTVRLEKVGLRELELGALATIEQHLELVSVTTMIDVVTLPALRKVGGNVKLESNPGLPALSLPLLATIGGVYGGIPLGSLLVTGNGPLAELALPGLREVTLDVLVRGNAALDSAALAAAASAARGKKEVCGNLGGLPACP